MQEHIDNAISMKPAAVSAVASAVAGVTSALPNLNEWTQIAAIFAAVTAGIYTVLKTYIVIRDKILARRAVPITTTGDLT